MNDATKQDSSSDSQPQSIASVFHRALLMIYVVSVLLAIPIIYVTTKNELFAQANKELKLMVDVVTATRAIVSKTTRPYFLAKGEFFSPVVSSTVMAKEMATHFHAVQPLYLIRMISDDPLNMDNSPEGLEREVLDSLRKSDSDKGVIQTGSIHGRDYLISAVPTKVHADCLMCHGDPATAPKEVTEKYGTRNGFNWKVDTIIGATIVGVPMSSLNDAVLKRAAIAIGVITLLFGGVLLILNGVVKKNIINPVLKITEAAKAISLGQLNEPLVSDRKDEIGALTRAFELMRRSINAASQQLAKTNKPRA